MKKLFESDLEKVSGGTSAETNELIKAAKGNPNLNGLWEQAYETFYNCDDSERDNLIVQQVLLQLGVESVFDSGKGKNNYNSGRMKHADVVSMLKNY